MSSMEYFADMNLLDHLNLIHLLSPQLSSSDSCQMFTQLAKGKKCFDNAGK